MISKNIATAIVIALIVVAGGITAFEINSRMAGSQQQKVVISETGSTLLYPVFNAWASNYTNATITTAGTGSGTGISSVIAGTAIIGASDAYLPPALASANPYVMNIPILISYQYVSYNIPSFNVTLNLSADILAGIYTGTITNWNDSAIRSANPGVQLPDHTIIPVHRSDGSGDTFMFTSFLSKGNTTWGDTIGASTNPNWPTVTASLTGNGNAGIISQMSKTPYSIGYIAATYSSDVSHNHLGIAYLKNQAGYYVAPTIANVSEAASHYLGQIPANGTIALQYAPGNSSYPIADMEYLIVKQNQTDVKTANALTDFLNWTVNSSGGSNPKYLEPLNLVALPSSVVNQITLPMINKIHG
ncbi:MAG: phosphate ABC transporter substrate-binding protein PstS [Candidatus Thermoplasmatota archaeon]|nr:phosphate ABC transporter substrate-binding protein PstS [Candidatus Thermoplasmatota archaeon]